MNTSSPTSIIRAWQWLKPLLAAMTIAAPLWLGYWSWLAPKQHAHRLAGIGGDLATVIESMSPLDPVALAQLINSMHYFSQLDSVVLSFNDPGREAMVLRAGAVDEQQQTLATHGRVVRLQIANGSEPVLARLTIGQATGSVMDIPLAPALFLLALALIVWGLRSRNPGVDPDELTRKLQSDGNQNNAEASFSPNDTADNSLLAETELAVARRSALEASRLKSELIANTSHELLTPLNSIVGYATLLEKTPGLSALQREFVHKISNSGQHLTALTNDLLDFALYGNRNLRLKYQTCDVGELLQTICEVLSVDAHNKRLWLLTDFDALFGVQIQTDPVRLRQVVTNLLVNAIRYTSAGHVAVAARLETTDAVHHQLCISLSDTGEGMPPELKEQVFSALVKADQLTEHIAGPGQGLGLGLAIVNNIVAQMGGSIDLQSELNEGSNFTVYLPVAEYDTSASGHCRSPGGRLLIYSSYAAARENLSHRLGDYFDATDCVATIAAAIERSPQCDYLVLALSTDDAPQAAEQSLAWLAPLTRSGKSLRILRPTTLELATPFDSQAMTSPARLANLLTDDAPTGQSDAANSPRPASSSPGALLVDDNPSNLEVLALMLEELGIIADTASGAAAAMPKLTKQRYRWLFIDLKMQPTNGMELLASIVEQGLQPDAAFIACTAHSSDEEFRALYDCGFEQVLHKPVDMELLANMVANVEPAQTPAKAAEPLRSTVFDTQYALSRTVNRPALAHRNLRTLLDDLDALLGSPAQARENREQITLQVHYTNGSAAMTGALAVKSVLDELESCLKDPASTTTSLEQHWRELSAQTKALEHWYKTEGTRALGQADTGY